MPLSVVLDAGALETYRMHLNTQLDALDLEQITDFLKAVLANEHVQNMTPSSHMPEQILNRLLETTKTVSDGDRNVIMTTLQLDLTRTLLKGFVEDSLKGLLKQLTDKMDAQTQTQMGGAFGFAARASKGIFDRLNGLWKGTFEQSMGAVVEQSKERFNEHIEDTLFSIDNLSKLENAKKSVIRSVLDEPLGGWYSEALSKEHLQTLAKALQDLAHHLLTDANALEFQQAVLNETMKSFGPVTLNDIYPLSSDQEWLHPKLTAYWQEFFLSDEVKGILGD